MLPPKLFASLFIIPVAIESKDKHKAIMVVLACGGCDPFLMLSDEPEDSILSDDIKNIDNSTMVMSSMEVVATASLMERNKTRSPGLESIPEVMSDRSDVEEREVYEWVDETTETASETGAEPQNNRDDLVIVKVTKQVDIETEITLLEPKDDVLSNDINAIKGFDETDAARDANEYLRAPFPSPSTNSLSPKMMQTNEQDYDKHPTELYEMLQRREWQQAIDSVEKDAHQVATWIARKEPNGELRWRLLPIHAAIIFNAPESVVEALLKAFPDGAQHKEDQGMLPLHLAFRMGSPESVVSLLLDAFPDSVNVTNRKGLTALELAEASNGPNKAAFIRALKNGSNAAKIPSLSSAHLNNIREENEKKIEELRKEATAKQSALQQEVLTLQKALVRKQENSQVLIDHIASLEAKLMKVQDGDDTCLDIKLGSLLSRGMEVEQIEKMYEDEFTILQARNRFLESKVSEMKHDKEKATDALKETLKIFETRKAEWNAEKKLHLERSLVYEQDCSALREQVSILEEQIKNRSISEKSLTAQMTVLAEQLHSATLESNSESEAFSARIRALENERENLRLSVNKLSKKLYFVAGLIDSVSKDQIAIVEQALQNENKAGVAAVEQGKIIMNVKEHSELVQDAKNLGDEIKELLTKHAEQMQKTYEARKFVVEAVEEQSRQLSSAEERREELIKGMTSFKKQILEVLDSVYDELPKEVPDEQDLVDTVLEKIIPLQQEDESELDNNGLEVEDEKKDEE